MKSTDEIRNISRRQAARSQIDMAIRAHILFDDPVSALTLAGAAERVLSDLHAKNDPHGAGAWSIRAFVNTRVKKEFRSQATNYLRDGYDFLRHADRSPDRQLELRVEIVDIFLFLALNSYLSLFKSTSPLMTAFSAWMFVERPDWHSDGYDPEMEEICRRNQNFRHRPKIERFKTLLDVVETQPISPIPNPQSLKPNPHSARAKS